MLIDVNYYVNHFLNMKFAFYLIVILANQKPDPESEIRNPILNPESGSVIR